MELIPLPQPDPWEAMVPERIRQQYSGLEEALCALEANADSEEAAVALFWRVYTFPKELAPSQDVIERVASLEEKRRPQMGPDVEQPWQRVFVYLHVAGCLAVALERKEPVYSERYIENLEGMERWWDWGVHKKVWSFDEDDAFGRSLHALVGQAAIRLFKVRHGEGKQEEALLDLAVGLSMLKQSGFQGELELDGQTAVDAFEKLYDNPNKVSWQKMAEWCRSIGNSQAFTDNMVNWKGETMQGYDFWIYVEGICKGRLSRTEYIKLRDSDKKRESEQRLRGYFFQDSWEGIPEPLQGDLIVIDKLWLSEEKVNLGSIVENLKLVAEQLLRPLLWERFLPWRDSAAKRGELKEIQKEILFDTKRVWLEKKCREPSLFHFLEVLRLSSFREFVASHKSLTKEDREFMLSSLGKPLSKLNKIRTPRAHPHSPRDWRREDLAPLLKDFLGIDCPGILPGLARIAKHIHSPGETH